MGVGGWSSSRPEGWSFWDNPLTLSGSIQITSLKGLSSLSKTGSWYYRRLHSVWQSSQPNGWVSYTHIDGAQGMTDIYFQIIWPNRSSSPNWLVSSCWLKIIKTAQVVIQHTLNHVVSQAALKDESLNCVQELLYIVICFLEDYSFDA
jgi:hypothetical protein